MLKSLLRAAALSLLLCLRFAAVSAAGEPFLRYKRIVICAPQYANSSGTEMETSVNWLHHFGRGMVEDSFEFPCGGALVKDLKWSIWGLEECKKQLPNVANQFKADLLLVAAGPPETFSDVLQIAVNLIPVPHITFYKIGKHDEYFPDLRMPGLGPKPITGIKAIPFALMQACSKWLGTYSLPVKKNVKKVTVTFAQNGEVKEYRAGKTNTVTGLSDQGGKPVMTVKAAVSMYTYDEVHKTKNECLQTDSTCLKGTDVWIDGKHFESNLKVTNIKCESGNYVHVVTWGMVNTPAHAGLFDKNDDERFVANMFNSAKPLDTKGYKEVSTIEGTSKRWANDKNMEYEDYKMPQFDSTKKLERKQMTGAGIKERYYIRACAGLLEYWGCVVELIKDIVPGNNMGRFFEVIDLDEKWIKKKNVKNTTKFQIKPLLRVSQNCVVYAETQRRILSRGGRLSATHEERTKYEYMNKPLKQELAIEAYAHMADSSGDSLAAGAEKLFFLDLLRKDGADIKVGIEHHKIDDFPVWYVEDTKRFSTVSNAVANISPTLVVPPPSSGRNATATTTATNTATKPGDKTPKKNDKKDDKKTVLIIAIGALVVIAIAAIVAIWCCCESAKKHKATSEFGKKPSGISKRKSIGLIEMGEKRVERVEAGAPFMGERTLRRVPETPSKLEWADDQPSYWKLGSHAPILGPPTEDGGPPGTVKMGDVYTW